MKKILTFLLLLSSHSVQASADHWTGLYQAATIGGILAQFDIKQDLEALVPNNVNIYRPSDLNLQSASVAGSIGLGYAHLIHSIFVANLEVTAGITNATNVHINDIDVPDTGGGGSVHFEGKVRSTLKNDFALLFKPGFLLQEKTQIYALIGPRWGYFETSQVSSVSFTNNFSETDEDHESGYELGWTLGLGLKRLVNDHVTVGLEYAYTDYGKIDAPSSNSIIFTGGVNGSLVDNLDIDASSSSLQLEVAYRF